MQLRYKYGKLTLFLSPGNQLGVVHSLLTFDPHELSQIPVMINNSQQFLHFSIVLLLVLVCPLLQKNHLGLGLIPNECT